ncbi:MAG: hypothetical protein K2H64_12070 [Desulfovibrio sp.]|nr:hypothetical protein [Desulfovibrio sp.]
METYILFHSKRSDPKKLNFASIDTIDIKGEKITINDDYEYDFSMTSENLPLPYNILKEHIYVRTFSVENNVADDSFKENTLFSK